MGSRVSICSQTQELLPNNSLCFSLFLSVFFLSISLSLSSCSRLINSSPYRFVRNWFFSGFLCGLDFRQNVRYWWAHSEGTGCGVLRVFVLIPEKSSWLSVIVQLTLVSVLLWSSTVRFPQETQQVLLIKSIVSETSFSQTRRHYFSLSVCLWSCGDCEAFIDPELIVWDSRVSPQGRWIDARHW